MTDEQKRIAIAEALGINPFRWKFRYQHEEGWDTTSPYDSLEKAEKDWVNIYDGPTYAEPIYKIVQCPDFLNDLDAMAEAERGFTDDQHWEQIKAMVNWKPSPLGFPLLSLSESIALSKVTARQRADAFLMTIGKL